MLHTTYENTTIGPRYRKAEIAQATIQSAKYTVTLVSNHLPDVVDTIIILSMIIFKLDYCS